MLNWELRPIGHRRAGGGEETDMAGGAELEGIGAEFIGGEHSATVHRY